jgi:acetylornithine deacetylase/succinyl-diaminopimelate desuccinylase-like protein
LRGLANVLLKNGENIIELRAVGTTNTARNCIPADAFADIDVRCNNLAEMVALDKEIKALANKTAVPGTKVLIEGPVDAFALIEVRCYEMAELGRLDREVRALADKTVVPHTRVSIEGRIEREPMAKTQAVAKLIDRYKAIVKKEYNADVVEWMAGGITVANTTAKFVPTIDALGVEVDPMLEHTEREEVDLNTFVPRTVALILLIDQMAREGNAKIMSS